MMSLFNFEVVWQTKYNISHHSTNPFTNPNVHSVLNPSKSIRIFSNPSSDYEWNLNK